jgi:hypothetical protein
MKIQFFYKWSLLLLVTIGTTVPWISARSQILPPGTPPQEAAQPTTDPSPPNLQKDGAMDVQLMPRQMMILREGLDAVYGQTMFVVRNNSSVPLAGKFRVLLPKETSDFSPREGLEPNEVILANPEGASAEAQGNQGFQGLLVDKVFAPGVSMMSIGFKVDAKLGSAELTLSHPQGVRELNILLLKEGPLVAKSDVLVKDLRTDVEDPQYDYFELKKPLEPGDVLTLKVEGVPEGRTRYWWMGGITAGVLILAAFFLTWKSWPKVVGDQKGETMLIG